MNKENFDKIMKLRNITRYQLSKATGISSGLLANYRNSVMKPGEENLILITDYLDCSIDYLVGRTDCPEMNHGDPNKIELRDNDS